MHFLSEFQLETAFYFENFYFVNEKNLFDFNWHHNRFITFHNRMENSTMETCSMIKKNKNIRYTHFTIQFMENFRTVYSVCVCVRLHQDYCNAQRIPDQFSKDSKQSESI